jgi:4-diphosphocytidyl-2-C-methyl-D-erythritol kinase
VDSRISASAQYRHIRQKNRPAIAREGDQELLVENKQLSLYNHPAMTVTVRSFAKINLGLRIGAARGDGFHELLTVYQTIGLHDVIRVSVARATGRGTQRDTQIEIQCADPRVPRDESNTCFRIVERALQALRLKARVLIEIEKRLPVQGGLGGASSNAVATLLGLERALKKSLPVAEKLRIAAEVGSDLPLFLVGGTVLGVGRGEQVYPLPDLPAMPCVVLTPEVGVSTPKAFAEWDRLCGAGASARELPAAKVAPHGRGCPRHNRIVNLQASAGLRLDSMPAPR